MKITLDGKSYEYTPKMDPEDFIRNNEEIDSEDTAKELMVALYPERIEENYWLLPTKN